MGEKGHGEGEQEDQRQGQEGAKRPGAAAGCLRPQAGPPSAGPQEAAGGAERREDQEGGGAEAAAEAQTGQVGGDADAGSGSSACPHVHSVLFVHPRLAEEYKEQSWAAMSELEKELQQIEAEYGEEFGDVSESEEDEVDMQENIGDGGGRGKWD